MMVIAQKLVAISDATAAADIVRPYTDPIAVSRIVKVNF
jgi:hypothetical protein